MSRNKLTGRTESQCPICRGPLTELFRAKKITSDGKHGWENDSTMELLDLSVATTSAGFCRQCFHTIRLPEIDTEKLYSEHAVKVRARHFKNYFSDQEYGGTNLSIKLDEVFHSTIFEYSRFAAVSKVLSKFLKDQTVSGDRLKIIDWGGGDGSVSGQYAHVLKYVSGCAVSSWVYDFSEWENVKDNRLNKKGLSDQGPFDIAILSHVLEHTHDPVQMINEISANLSDKGILIIEVPDERMNIIRSVLGKPVTLHYHVAWYSRLSLSNLLGRCGFKRRKTLYHYRSSYHGKPMTTILSVGQKNSLTNEDIFPCPGPAREFLNLILFSIRKLMSKVLGMKSFE